MNAKRTVALFIISVIAFGIILTIVSPFFTPSDEEVKEKFRNSPEVQALYQRYTPDWVTVSHEGIINHVGYGVDRTWNIRPNGTFTEDTQILKRMVLNGRDSPLGSSFVLVCTGGISSSGESKQFSVVEKPITIEGIRTADCVETPAPPA